MLQSRATLLGFSLCLSAIWLAGPTGAQDRQAELLDEARSAQEASRASEVYGQLEHAARYSQRALEIGLILWEPAETAAECGHLGLFGERAGRADAARAWYRLSLYVETQGADSEDRAERSLDLADALARYGWPSSAAACYRSATRAYRQAIAAQPTDSLLPDLRWSQGRSAAMALDALVSPRPEAPQQTGDPAEVLRVLRSAVTLLRGLPVADTPWRWRFLGGAFDAMGVSDEALACYQSAAETAAADAPLDRVESLCALAEAELGVGAVAEALADAREAARSWREDPGTLGPVLETVAMALCSSGAPQEAAELCDLAVGLAEESDDGEASAQRLEIKGDALCEAGDTGGAIMAYREAAQAYAALLPGEDEGPVGTDDVDKHYRHQRGRCLLRMGLALRKSGAPADATTAILEAADVLASVDDSDGQVDCLEQLVELDGSGWDGYPTGLEARRGLLRLMLTVARGKSSAEPTANMVRIIGVAQALSALGLAKHDAASGLLVAMMQASMGLEDLVWSEVARSRETGDLLGQASSLMGLVYSTWLLADTEQASRALGELVDLVVHHGAELRSTRTHHLLRLSVFSDEDEYEEDPEEPSEATVLLGMLPALEAQLRAMLGMSYYWTGRYDDALQQLAAALQTSDEQRAMAEADESVEVSAEQVQLYTGLCRLKLGQFARAKAVLLDAARGIDGSGVSDTPFPPLWWVDEERLAQTGLGDAYAGLGDHEAAVDEYEGALADAIEAATPREEGMPDADEPSILEPLLYGGLEGKRLLDQASAAHRAGDHEAAWRLYRDAGQVSGDTMRRLAGLMAAASRVSGASWQQDSLRVGREMRALEQRVQELGQTLGPASTSLQMWLRMMVMGVKAQYEPEEAIPWFDEMEQWLEARGETAQSEALAPVLPLQRAQCALRAGRYEEAVRSLSKVLAAALQWKESILADPTVGLTVGGAAVEDLARDAAVELLYRTVTKECRAGLAEAYLDLGMYEEARSQGEMAMEELLSLEQDMQGAGTGDAQGDSLPLGSGHTFTGDEGIKELLGQTRSAQDALGLVLGRAYLALEQPQLAREHLERAAESHLQAGRWTEVVDSCVELARACRALGRSADAAHWLDASDAMSVSLSRLLPLGRTRARCSLERGMLLSQRHEYAAALQQFRFAAAQARAVVASLGTQSGWTPEELHAAEAAVGRVLWQQGDLLEAFEHYSRAVALVERLRGRGASSLELRAAYQATLAWVYDEMIQLLSAMKLQGIAVSQMPRQDSDPSFWSGLGIAPPAYWGEWGSFDDAMVHFSESSRSRALRDLLANAPLSLGDAATEELWRRRNELSSQERRLREQLAAQRDPESADAKGLRDQLRSTQAEQRQAEAEFAATAFGQLADAGLGTPERYRASLSPSQAVVEYKVLPDCALYFVVTSRGTTTYRTVVPAACRLDDASGNRASESQGRLARLYAAWQRSPGPAALPELGLEGLVSLAREPMEALAGKREPLVQSQDHLAVLALLYDRLVRPLEAPLSAEGIRRLCVVPDGPLCSLPFAALVSELPEDLLSIPGDFAYGHRRLRYAIDRWDITYMPSLSVHLALPGVRRARGYAERSDSAPGRLCGLADPVFSAADPRAGTALPDAAPEVPSDRGAAEALTEVLNTYHANRSADRGTLGRLLGTRLELDRAMEAFGADPARDVWDRRQAPGDWLDSQGFVGRGAIEKRLYDPRLRAYDCVLIGTHGIIDNDHPLFSYLAFTAPEPALAGEQAPTDGPCDDDGCLTLGEAFGLQMDARVVTLSACQTGLGRNTRGEGIVGLTMAMLYSGARAVTVSLWSVDDRRTAELMGAYHQLMGAADRQPADALMASQRQVLEAARGAWEEKEEPVWSQDRLLTEPEEPVNALHPYYWAPFVLQE